MATQKQLAALKKARAARAKNIAAKKNSVKKKTAVKKVAVTAKSRITKKAPSARLKKRRAANTKKGYFPNPDASECYVVTVRHRALRGFFVAVMPKTAAGMQFDTDINKAYRFDGVHGKDYVHLMVNALIAWAKAKNIVASFTVKKFSGTGYAKNPVPESSKTQLKSAAKLYEDFTGHDATYFDEVPIEWPKVALRVGLCDGVLYETIRDGKVEHYVHKFKKSARPVLAASHNGKQLSLIGGKFAFTERGIVDK